MKFNDILFMISCLLLNACPIQSETCQATLTSFSISTRRNNTGHWSSEVIVDIGSDETTDEDKKQNGPWNLGVTFSRERCDGNESLHIVVAMTVPPPKPGPGYELFAGVGYYKFHTTIKTWYDARKTCANEGGHLAILNSDAEANIAKQLFAQHPQLGKWAFVGFHDESIEGQYTTIFGEPLQATGYTKWGKGQPDNFGGNKTYAGEDCGTVDRDGTLNDLPCGAKVPFICEHEL